MTNRRPLAISCSRNSKLSASQSHTSTNCQLPGNGSVPLSHKRLSRVLRLRFCALVSFFGIYGEGEWKVRQHGVGKRRTWRKLHLAVAPDTHEIVAQVLTENNVHDADQVAPLLEQIDRPVRTFYGDGA